MREPGKAPKNKAGFLNSMYLKGAVLYVTEWLAASPASSHWMTAVPLNHNPKSLYTSANVPLGVTLLWVGVPSFEVCIPLF